MKAVSDSSVLIGLSSIGRLSILKSRFTHGVLVPDAVWREVVESGGDRPGGQEVREAEWVQCKSVRDQDYIKLLSRELDAGEAEAIVLARQEQADVVLLDEKEARRVARRLGIQVLGTVGILIWARRKGLISNLRAELKLLQEQGGFRLGKDIFLEALRQVGELD